MTTTTKILQTVASNILDGDRVNLGNVWRTATQVVTYFATREVEIMTADGGRYVLGMDAPVSVYDLR